MIFVTPLESASAKTTLLEILVTSVRLDTSTSPLVKIANVMFKDPWIALATLKENVLAIMDTLEINVTNAYLTITCITMSAKVNVSLTSFFQQF